MTADVVAFLWAALGVFAFIICAAVGALYLRLTGLLDDTAQRLQSVAESLADHGARIGILERSQ